MPNYKAIIEALILTSETPLALEKNLRGAE